jgi:hypothetical protein
VRGDSHPYRDPVAGDGDPVDVVGHEGEAQQAEVEVGGIGGDQRQVDGAILFRIKDILAVVTPLGDVMRAADGHHAFGSCHTHI